MYKASIPLSASPPGQEISPRLMQFWSPPVRTHPSGVMGWVLIYSAESRRNHPHQDQRRPDIDDFRDNKPGLGKDRKSVQSEAYYRSD